MKKLVIICLALGMFFGCGTTKYCHLTKDASDFEHDKYICENIAFQKAANFGAAGNPLIIRDEMDRCLRHKFGWYPCR